MPKKLVELNGKMYELKAYNGKIKSKTPKNTKESNTKKSLKWFKDKLRLTVKKTGLKVSMPTKNGMVEYAAVQFSNDRIGVVLKSGIVKYAWA